MAAKKISAPPPSKAGSTVTPSETNSIDATSEMTSHLQPIDLEIAAFTPTIAQANMTMATTHALANQALSAGQDQVMSDMQLQIATVQGLNSLIVTGQQTRSR